uniref:Mucolipin extracytosolic domain-containing protein n=1 Tax=Neogobius melanostomus TaxID=47308 RepID=A0A8C6ULG6_9GOBI
MEESEPLVPHRSGLGRVHGQYGWRGHVGNSESHIVDDFRRKLKYFFMNPCEKYRARGRKPWKLLIQILKIVIITAQLVSFGLSNEMMVTFKDESLLTFKHLFLKEFKDHQMEPFAIYTKTDLYDHIYYVIDRYIHLQNLTVGNLANSSIDPGNETFNIDPHLEQGAFDSIQHLLSASETVLTKSLISCRLLSVNIYLTLKSINLQTVRHQELPDCYDFQLKIIFDNSAHSGRITIAVDSNVTHYECRDWTVEGTSDKNNYELLAFDSVVILACFASFILCIRSIINGIQLQFVSNVSLRGMFFFWISLKALNCPLSASGV